MEQKVKKPKSKVRKIIEWVGTIIIGIVFVFAAVCNVAKLLTRNEYGYGTSFGYSSYVVLTDSMEPVYPVKSAIVVYKDKPEEIVKQWNEIAALNLDPTDERCLNLTFVDAYEMHVETYNPLYYSQTSCTKAVMTHQLFDIRVDTTKEEGQGRYTFLVHGINISEHQAQQGQYQAFTEKELLGVVKTNSQFVGAISSFLSSVWGLLIVLLIPCLYLVISSFLDIFKALKDDDENGDGGNGKLSEKEYEALKQQMLDEMLSGKAGKK